MWRSGFFCSLILLSVFQVESNQNGCRLKCNYGSPGACQLDCSGLNLKSVAGINVTSNIESINFSDNKIETLASDFFFNGGQLLSADFSRNKINAIADGTFSGFTKLQTLSLAHNDVWELQLNALANLTELVKLDLSFNRLTVWDSQVFTQLKSLAELNLQHNTITSLGSNFFSELPFLERLLLDDNELVTLPDDLFQKNPRLKYLSLRGNNFNVVPNSALVSASNLFFLDLSSTKLTRVVYENFRGLDKIDTLRISRIHSLLAIEDYAFQDLKQLKTFYCDHNIRLTKISDKAFLDSDTDQPLTLEKFYLRHTRVFYLGEKLLDWHSLTLLDLGSNPWNCDCRLRWISNITFPEELRGELICERPWLKQGKKIVELKRDDFVCPFHLLLDLDLVSLLLLIIVLCMAATIALYLCIKLSLCRKLKKVAAPKGDYTRVFARKDNVDLEWDASF